MALNRSSTLGPVRHGQVWKHPGLPAKWTPVLEQNAEAMNPDPLPGYVWLDTPGKALHVQATSLEFRQE